MNIGIGMGTGKGISGMMHLMRFMWIEMRRKSDLGSELESGEMTSGIQGSDMLRKGVLV